MWNQYTHALVALAAAGAISQGCGKVSSQPPDAAPDPIPDAGPCLNPPCIASVANFPVRNSRDLDLLFVIDDSNSMAEEQTSLVASFGELVSALEDIEGGLPNLHIGVISTNLGVGGYPLAYCEGEGDGGRMLTTPRVTGCTGPNGAYIADVADEAGNRLRNYDGTLADTFACIAQLGNQGCGFERTLESLRKALDGTVPENQGFLRTEATLGVVIISDEDDCSVFDTRMFDPDPAQNSLDSELGPLSSFRCFDFGVQCSPDTPRELGAKLGCVPREESAFMPRVSEFVDFLHQLKPSSDHIIVATITGDPEPVTAVEHETLTRELGPSCESATGKAAPAVRLDAFARGFPGRNVISSICDGNYAEPLRRVGERFAHSFRGACLGGTIKDTDPAAPGLQYACTVAELSGFGASPMPACDTPTDPESSTNQPCYVINLSPTLCADTPSELAVSVYYDATTIPAGTRAVVNCEIE